jgi:hypothetical protein
LEGKASTQSGNIDEVGGGGSCFLTIMERPMSGVPFIQKKVQNFYSKLFFITKLAFFLRGIMLRHAH